MLKLFCSDQEDPLYSSVSAEKPGPRLPPNATAAVVVPDAPVPLLTVFKSDISDQLVPLKLSTFAYLDGPKPPIANAAVCVPALPT